MHGRDEDEVNQAVCATICARCRARLSIGGHEESDLLAAHTAHAGQCFIVGDRVRSLGYHKVEGVIERVIATGCFSVRISADIPGSGYKAGACMAFSWSILRRIERPEQAVKRPGDGRFHATDCGYYDSVDAECTCDERNESPPHTETDHVEGIPRSCLLKHYEEDQRNDWPPSLSVAQRQAAGEQWTQQLRLKQQEARERERLQVVAEQDAGDFEW